MKIKYIYNCRRVESKSKILNLRNSERKIRKDFNLNFNKIVKKINNNNNLLIKYWEKTKYFILNH